nr:MAG TPA: hypothetical protein [Caudoviricetes sp.]
MNVLYYFVGNSSTTRAVLVDSSESKWRALVRGEDMV